MNTGTTLVDSQIADGKRLIKEMPQHGVEVTAGFWIQSSYDYRWSFYIVSPLVESEGLRQAYGRLHPWILTRSQTGRIDGLAIRLIGPDEPLARDFLAAIRVAPGAREGPIRWRGKWLGNMSIEDSYFYPLANTSGSETVQSS